MANATSQFFFFFATQSLSSSLLVIEAFTALSDAGNSVSPDFSCWTHSSCPNWL